MKKKDKREEFYSRQFNLTKANKYSNKNGKTVVLPSSSVDTAIKLNHEYTRDIDEKVLRMAVKLAEKLATTMVRESLNLNVQALADQIIEGVSTRIIKELPDQTAVIQQVVSSEAESIKKEAQSFDFEGPDMTVDRSDGHKLQGKIGKKQKSKKGTSDALDALDNLL